MTLIQSIVSGGGGIVDKTHAEMLALVAASGFTPGQMYRITDFRTYHLITGTLLYHTGEIESLIVLAISVSGLSPVAHSEAYPQDIIHYELADTSLLGGDRGRITYREDSVVDIAMHGDWRGKIVRRWNTQADGLGSYSEYADNGYPYQDTAPIADLNACTNVFVGKGNDNDTGNIFIGSGKDIFVGADGNDITILGGSRISIGESGDPCVIGLGSAYITIGYCAAGTSIGANCFNVDVQDSSKAVVGDGCTGVTVERCFGSYGIIVQAGVSNVYASYVQTGILAHEYIVADSGHDTRNRMNMSYNDMSLLVAASALVRGQKYQITDKDNAVVEATSINTYRPYHNGIATIDAEVIVAGVLNLTDYPYADTVAILDATEVTPLTIISITAFPTSGIEVAIKPGSGCTITLPNYGLGAKTLIGSNSDFAMLYWDTVFSRIRMRLFQNFT